jgi:hypothetical protein
MHTQHASYMNQVHDDAVKQNRPTLEELVGLLLQLVGFAGGGRIGGHAADAALRRLATRPSPSVIYAGTWRRLNEPLHGHLIKPPADRDLRADHCAIEGWGVVSWCGVVRKESKVSLARSLGGKRFSPISTSDKGQTCYADTSPQRVAHARRFLHHPTPVTCAIIPTTQRRHHMCVLV